MNHLNSNTKQQKAENHVLTCSKKLCNYKSALLILYLLISSALFSQEKPIRIGVKLGLPNVIGGNIEYVTPLLNKRLAVTIDYSSLSGSSTEDEAGGSFTYFAGGLNYYFSKEGKGLYGNLGYGSFNGNATFTDVDSEEGTQTNGVSKVAISYKSVNLMIGAKLGGLFYFRPEIGFALPGFPDDIVENVTFPDGSTETQSFSSNEDVPGIIRSGFIFNIGIGFAF
ncbi:MAG: hypothetical protein KDC97_03510 [Confluentibacter sp.]|nr:hypothetical protein [Confluentibacter sp.]